MSSIRTQVYMTREQRRRLDERRRRERRPLAALIREALDAYLADQTADRTAALDETFGTLPRLQVPDRNEWEHARPSA